MNTPAELETLRDWLRYAVSRFNAGRSSRSATAPTNAYDEAAYLLLHALHLPLDRLEPFLDAKLTHAERSELARAARAAHRRARSGRVPDARGVARRIPLLRRRARASSRARSSPSCCRTGSRPTSATAIDVQVGARPLHGLGLPCRSCSRTRSPHADVDAVDISPDALAVAQRNVSDYGLAGRINLIRSDLFANLPEKTYDLIISNPPYVTTMAMDELPREYRHEPRWRSPAATTGSTRCARSCARRRSSALRDGAARRRDRPQPRRRRNGVPADAVHVAVDAVVGGERVPAEARGDRRRSLTASRSEPVRPPRSGERASETEELLDLAHELARASDACSARASASSACSFASFSAWRSARICASASASAGRPAQDCIEAALVQPVAKCVVDGEQPSRCAAGRAAVPSRRSTPAPPASRA